MDTNLAPYPLDNEQSDLIQLVHPPDANQLSSASIDANLYVFGLPQPPDSDDSIVFDDSNGSQTKPPFSDNDVHQNIQHAQR